jgi:hypothetical protein
MKAEAGWGAAALVAVAAFVGVTSQPGGKGANEAGSALGRVHSTPRAVAGEKTSFERGACGDLEEKIQTFLLMAAEKIAAPDSCYDEATPDERSNAAKAEKKGGEEVRTRAASLRYVIAIVPDPLHTHFSLSFDRLVEAIQQGAQDEGYLYDSSWMPWETEKPTLLELKDQDTADDRTKAREDQPGILLFRKRPEGNGDPPTAYSGEPYRDGLAVFVVGEEPTSGIHKRQFENAARWINALQPAEKGKVKILGPTFSGSLPSLAQSLDEDLSPAIPKRGEEPANPLAIYSGGITSESGVAWFKDRMKARFPALQFRSFQESDTQLLKDYRLYLAHQGFEMRRLAIVSEDETAFGEFDDEANSAVCKPAEKEGKSALEEEQPRTGDSKPASRTDKWIGPACLFYPRDISALRAEYQKQSIFGGGSGDKAAEAGRHTLSTDLADPGDEDHDTVRSYSGNKTALSEEASLQQIVSVLRAHESEYIVLRSSNPLDQLFLSHFLRVTYPQGRVVIEGSDLLLRREGEAATLSGIMTLTTYPLLPWESHWASLNIEASRHAHRVFTQDLAEGTYVASRFLLHTPTAEQKKILAQGGGCVATEQNPSATRDFFLPPNCLGLQLSEYAPPFWSKPYCANNAKDCDPQIASRRPPTWLSVLGRDGFWPVAALPRTDEANSGGTAAGTATDATGEIAYTPPTLSERTADALSAWRYLFRLKNSEADYAGWPEWPPMPLNMKVFLLLMLLWAIFHLQCCALPSLMVKPAHRAYFVRVPAGHHLALIVLGSVFLALVPVFIEWGYGAMSANGEPVRDADAYRLLLSVVWLMGGAAIALNAWIEFPPRQHPKWTAKCFEACKPVAWYVGVTWFAYCLVDFSLGEGMTQANRIPTYWRSINLTNGVSPLVPLIALAGGLYMWFWYSLQGLAFFNEDSPLLPTRFQLEIAAKDGNLKTLRMFSREEAGMPLDRACRPFAKEFWLAAVIIFPALLLIGDLVASDVPFRSLGSKDFSRFFGIGMAVVATLMLANAWQLLRVWLNLRQLLVFLDRLHLRRTMKALNGYSWGSVWGMGGRILDIRYKLLSRQMECLTHLQNSLRDCKNAEAPAWMSQLKETQQVRGNFAKWFSDSWRDSKERDLSHFFQVQRSIAKTAGVVMAQVLVPYWRLEDTSLIQKLQKSDDDAKENAKGGEAAGNGDDHGIGAEPPNYIRNAEELVCLVYLGFIQNILGRMRTIVMQMAWLFVAAAVAVASYPFDPRSQVSGSMIVLFLTLATVIAAVYAQMHRDSTLSLVTDTKPGELGVDFWFKLIGFGAGPILGLLATIFPELPGSLFSWLQPGLDSIK